MLRTRSWIVFLLLILILLAVSVLLSLLPNWLHAGASPEACSSGSSLVRDRTAVGHCYAPGTEVALGARVEVGK